MTLDEYLDAQAGRRWRWGAVDCVQFGLGWAREATGRPLTAFFDYADRKGALSGMNARGGLLAIVDAWMDANGFLSVENPEDGDIGLVPTQKNGEDGIAGCSVVIRCGPWWIGKTLNGAVWSTFSEKIPAWRVS